MGQRLQNNAILIWQGAEIRKKELRTTPSLLDPYLVLARLALQEMHKKQLGNPLFNLMPATLKRIIRYSQQS